MRDGSVERAVILPAEPGAVWRALSEPDGLVAWLGEVVSLELVAGGRMELRWPDGAVRAAVFEEIEPPRALAFRWLPFERLPDGSARTVPPSRVALILEPHPDGTVLRVTESRAVPTGSAGRSEEVVAR